MPGNVWLGSIFLQKGGFKVVLKALQHYKSKVANVGSNPQLKDSPITLKMLIVDEGKKTAEKIDMIIKIINAAQKDPKLFSQIQFERGLIQKALKTYQEDIEQITKTMKERYTELFDEPREMEQILPAIKEAQENLEKFE